MNPDIHVPRPVSEAADELARSLGISRSELYTAALTSYVARLEAKYVTALLDRVYKSEASTIEPEWVAVQVAALGDKDW